MDDRLHLSGPVDVGPFAASTSGRSSIRNGRLAVAVAVAGVRSGPRVRAARLDRVTAPTPDPR